MSIIISLGIYLFWSACLWKICKHAGIKPGMLVWIPLLQAIPLLKAADLSPWWVLSWLVVPIMIIVLLVTFATIFKKIGLSPLLVILLVFPVVNLLALGFVAFAYKPKGRLVH